MPTEDARDTPQQQAPFRRSEDFFFDYANHVYLESSAWDLKLIFGQLDQSTKPLSIEQRAAITIPWLQAKILAFLLSGHVKGFEVANGTIQISKDLIPPEMPPPTEEQLKAEPKLRKLVEIMKQLRRQFLGSEDS